MYKYSLDKKLLEISVENFSVSIKVICKTLDISVRTLNRYRKIRLDSKQSISEEHAEKLAIILGCSVAELRNYEIKASPLKELIAQSEKTQSQKKLASKHGLQKPDKKPKQKPVLV